MISLTVNNVSVQSQSDPETPLLWVLRDELGLISVKYSCGIGECGACTVLMDGTPIQSCSTTLAEAAGTKVITLEGLDGEVAKRVQEAWEKEDVPQCGFCQPAQILTAISLLEENPSPSDEEIVQGMNGVLCRCGTYPAIVRAVKRAAQGGTKS